MEDKFSWFNIIQGKIEQLPIDNNPETNGILSNDGLINLSGFSSYHPVNLDFMDINLDKYSTDIKLCMIYFMASWATGNECTKECHAEKLVSFLVDKSRNAILSERFARKVSIEKLIEKRVSILPKPNIEFWAGFIRNVFLFIDIELFKHYLNKGTISRDVELEVAFCYVNTIFLNSNKELYSKTIEPIISDCLEKFYGLKTGKTPNILQGKLANHEKDFNVENKFGLSSSIGKLSYITKWANNKKIEINLEASEIELINQLEILVFFAQNSHRVKYFADIINFNSNVGHIQSILRKYLETNKSDFFDKINPKIKDLGLEEKRESEISLNYDLKRKIVGVFFIEISNFKEIKNVGLPNYIITELSLKAILPEEFIPKGFNINPSNRKNKIIEQ